MTVDANNSTLNATSLGAKVVFARQEPHADILRSVAGEDAESGAVSLPEVCTNHISWLGC